MNGECNHTVTPAFNHSSSSTLAWPYQPRPNSASWKTWASFLHHFTTTTSSCALRHPLGSWFLNTTRHRLWKYQYDPICDEILKIDATKTERFKLTSARTRQDHVYQRCPQIGPYHQTYPVTPYLWTDDRITAVPQRAKGILMKDTAYLHQLPLQIQYLVEAYPSSFNNATSITIASDGGLRYDNTTFGGLICADGDPLISVSGRAPTHSWPTSLTAEAYGIFYTTQVLIQVTSPTYSRPLRILADNTSLLSGLQSRRSPVCYPTHCLQPEHELLQSTAELLQRFPTVTYQHVKGHQPSSASPEAALNNQCDSLATQSRSLPPPTMNTMELPERRATLILNSKEVSS
jgi:hypothetical protein